jgi:hypothetical protein
LAIRVGQSRYSASERRPPPPPHHRRAQENTTTPARQYATMKGVRDARNVSNPNM